MVQATNSSKVNHYGTLLCIKHVYTCVSTCTYPYIRTISTNVIICRWLKSWNVSISSEKQQRMLAAKLADGIAGESVLFSFNEKGKGQVMRQAAYVWVEDLQAKIADTLNNNER